LPNNCAFEHDKHEERKDPMGKIIQSAIPALYSVEETHE